MFCAWLPLPGVHGEHQREPVVIIHPAGAVALVAVGVADIEKLGVIPGERSVNQLGLFPAAQRLGKLDFQPGAVFPCRPLAGIPNTDGFVPAEAVLDRRIYRAVIFPQTAVQMLVAPPLRIFLQIFVGSGRGRGRSPRRKSRAI